MYRNGPNHRHYESSYYYHESNNLSNKQYHVNPYHNDDTIPMFKWNNDEIDSSPNNNSLQPDIESFSDPIPSHFKPLTNVNSNSNTNIKYKSIDNQHDNNIDHKNNPNKKSKRKRKNILDFRNNRHHIHPSMNTRNIKTSTSTKKNNKHRPQNDSNGKTKNSPKHKLQIVPPDISGNLVDL